MKVSELTGHELDYWVARAEGLTTNTHDCVCVTLERGVFRPSADWAQGGPIIEREGITTYKARVCWLANCAAYLDEEKPPLQGRTPLEAAMRCHVASKFGEEVPDETV